MVTFRNLVLFLLLLTVAAPILLYTDPSASFTTPSSCQFPPLFLISDFESIWSHSNFSVFDSVAKRDFLDEVTALVSIILFPSIDVFFKVYSFLTLFLIQSFNSDGNHLNLLPRVNKLSLVSSPQIFPRLLINLFVSIAL